jgi:hypothetical protein
MNLGVPYFQTNHLSLNASDFFPLETSGIYPFAGRICSGDKTLVLGGCDKHLGQALDDLETAAHQVRLWLGGQINDATEVDDASQWVIAPKTRWNFK